MAREGKENTKLPDNIMVYSDSEKRSFVLVSEDKVVEITKKFINEVYKKLYQ
ncbi:hypothetical protein [Clostridium sp.]|uniref:hypothetical protein n=1 Tax=Clostridium sp. TaxID=1506 RepID=UPI003D6CBFD8